MTWRSLAQGKSSLAHSTVPMKERSEAEAEVSPCEERALRLEDHLDDTTKVVCTGCDCGITCGPISVIDCGKFIFLDRMTNGH